MKNARQGHFVRALGLALVIATSPVLLGAQTKRPTAEEPMAENSADGIRCLFGRAGGCKAICPEDKTPVCEGAYCVLGFPRRANCALGFPRPATCRWRAAQRATRAGRRACFGGRSARCVRAGRARGQDAVRGWAWTADRGRGAARDGGALPKTLSDGGGVARIGLDGAAAGAGRPLVFEAHRAGYAPDQRSATPRAGQELLLGDWTLVASGRIEGSVVDENGRGLAGVQVGCLREDLAGEDWERDRRLDLAALWRPAARAETAADGSFVLADAPSGRIRIVAVDDERPAGRSDFVELSPGGRVHGVEVRMEAADGGTTITGIVLDPSGAPVPFAAVKVMAARASFGIGADAGGRFRLRLSEREACDVTAQDPERRFREAALQGVWPGAEELVLSLASASVVELSVHSRQGAPIERFAVATIAVDDAEVLAFRGFSPSRALSGSR